MIYDIAVPDGISLEISQPLSEAFSRTEHRPLTVLNSAPNICGKGGTVFVLGSGLIDISQQPGAVGLMPNIDAIK